MLKSLIAALVLVTVAPVVAFSQELPDHRYQIEKTKYGFVRLDSRTGAMTFCREDDEDLVCTPAQAEKTEVEADLAALGARFNALEMRLKSAEERTIAAEDAARAAMDQLKVLSENTLSRPKLPTEKDVDEAFSYMEKFMRRFMDMSRELYHENPLPQRS